MKRIHTLRAVSMAIGMAIAVALSAQASAATVEFKLNPTLKGREYKQALQSASALGSLSLSSGANGAHRIETANEDQAKRAATALREQRSVIWASTVTSESVDADKIPAVRYADRALAIQVKRGEDAKKVVARIAQSTGQTLKLRRVASGDRAVVILPADATPSMLAAVSVAAQSDASVAGVGRMRMMTHHAQPSDPLWSQQWSLGDGAGGIRALGAWDLTPSGSVGIAVLDTGIRSHVDLDGKYISGYDLVSDEFVAVDGDLRDADPSDPGDFDTTATCSYPDYSEPSSWHGTHVAGIAAAHGNNGMGIVGVAPDSRVQSIRVLGRCGGYDVDVADGIRWAAGVPVPGIPLNRNPVKVMNLSLGGAGPCEADMQSAVDAAVANGTVVVVSAGNSALPASLFSPANCKGVITVGASQLLGDITSYSNYGDLVEISAPGGDGGGLPGVLSTLNGNGTQPGTQSYAAYSGTSMAAPHVAGVISLMLARDPSLTPGQILNRLQTTSRAFPVGSACAGAPGACGAGLLDAANAVASVPLNRGINEVSSRADRLHVVELSNPLTRRYTLSADPVEVARLLKSGWVKTGQIFPTYSFTALDQELAVAQPVCRASYENGGATTFSANTAECLTYAKAAGFAPDGVVFAGVLPNSNVCPRGSDPVWEMALDEGNGNFNLRTIRDSFEISNILAAGWRYNRVAFCAPN
jgi:serine protease